MLGGHERDCRRARLVLSLSRASLAIRHGVARFPGMSGLDYLTFQPWPLGPAAAERQAARHAHHRCNVAVGS
jgi:hypothetical protein